MVTSRKSYYHFALDFINSIKYHDNRDAWSKNGHEQNYHIVLNLLQRHQALTEKAFILEHFSHKDAQELIDAYYASDLKKEKHPLPKITTDNHIIDLIVQIAGEVKLFEEEISREDAVALIGGGKAHRVLHSLNNTLIALFFDKLASLGLVSNTWQAEIARQELIVSSTGKGFLTQHSLSSSLNQQKERTITTKERQLLTVMEKTYNQLFAKE